MSGGIMSEGDVQGKCPDPVGCDGPWTSSRSTGWSDCRRRCNRHTSWRALRYCVWRVQREVNAFGHELGAYALERNYICL